MRVCSACGRESPDEFRFCPICGSSLAVLGQVKEQRKVVTTLFCDVVGSTSLGEQLGAESYQQVLFRYFDIARKVLMSHGGIVDKFIGDAVMSVFGIPVAHEDDAFRAVRAAVEIRRCLDELNDDLERQWRASLEVRMGICTGEVFTGAGESIATGDALNVAARLEQAASPGETLLEEETLRLVHSNVVVEAVEPLQLKGKSSPTPAYRLIDLRIQSQPSNRYFDAPLIGREHEKSRLEDTWNETVKTSSCQLITVIGTPGVGKSRLVSEFTKTIQGARASVPRETTHDMTVLYGRCLSYGEGITYWPIVEILKQLEPRFDEFQLGEEASAAVRNLLVESQAIASEEIGYGIRRLFETVAGKQPLLIVFDDIHWGQQTFIDLLTYITAHSDSSPIMLLCIARPELREHYPTWTELHKNVIALEPLDDEESEKLSESLASTLNQRLRDRVLRAANGNPLFIEEMIAFLREQPDTDPQQLKIPPNINALLTARLDQLETDNRIVLEHGSVEGQIFHRGAVKALTPTEPHIDSHLQTLTQKELIHPDRPQLAGDQAYRFRHLLIRDAAYKALPKSSRAKLHEQLAIWMENNPKKLVELDEIVGYHLEQAYQYRTTLSAQDPHAATLATRAGERLLTAGHRAQQRDDIPAAKNLLNRATNLLNPDTSSYRTALLTLGQVIGEENREQAQSILHEALSLAEQNNDKHLKARAELTLIETEVDRDTERRHAKTIPLIDALEPTLRGTNDEEGIIDALRIKGCSLFFQGRSAAATETFNDGFHRATNAAMTKVAGELGMWLAFSIAIGPMPATEGIRACKEIEKHAPQNSRQQAAALIAQGRLEAMQALFERGRNHIAQGRSIFAELGLAIHSAGLGMIAGELELLADNPKDAQKTLEDSQKILQNAQSIGFLATTSSYLAWTLVAQGLYNEALQTANDTERITAADDIDTHLRLNAVRIQALAHLGDIKSARGFAQSIDNMTAQTDYLHLKTLVALSNAELERLAGNPLAEQNHLTYALELAQQKEHIVYAQIAQKRLNALVQEVRIS